MLEIPKPNYYAVVPANVRYAAIPASAKLLYGEITALCDKKGYCWATNSYFANLYQVTERNITRWLAELVKFGFCRVDKNVGGGRQICLGGVDNFVLNTEYDLSKPNTTLNITNNNTPKGVGVNEKILLDMINSLTGRSFRTLPRGSAKTLKLFSQSEIGTALDNMKRDGWHSEKMKDLSIDYMLRATTIDKFLTQKPSGPEYA